ncbi:hypothetical protein BVC93_25050 [Mycobacterium sp. MS1601]|uniref:bifunctional aminoglycoside phosphotransferase/ATP-binding protein n=1 Tax=Mycobacterium sp. MS1601 TaxID=1936029 RepID=UPI0009796846|nr:AAA family ATPase [Mycobacterium sp. MS1601]AQA05127.1 hypothetical protein BVC93_25050 [Mycobacterium sp. MS1601]
MTRPPVVSATVSAATGSADVEVRETHTGIVVLVGDRAYKSKKAVVTDFLDFRTRETRERACAREVDLNRRLAPTSYLGVGHFHTPDGAAPEPVVVMKRYSEDIRLRPMLERGEPTERHLTALARTLARFHAGAARSPVIDNCASVTGIAGRWQENLSALDRFAGELVTAEQICELRRLAMRFLAGRAPLFASRVAEHRVIDGHGDLTTDDIFCTEDGPVPLDCLEFDDQLRYVDGIDDAAFLAMDLEFLGRPELAALFLDSYRRAAADPAPTTLAHFYIAYRAVVRAKVDCIKVTQGQRAARADVYRHIDVAQRHLRSGTVRLVLIGGGPGTGKSTLASALRDVLGAQVISTDLVRRELQHRGRITGEVGDVDRGLYDPANVSAVYAEVLERAGQALGLGRSVILDGTWRDARQRRRAFDLAQRASAALVQLCCTTNLSEAQSRLTARGPTDSDATARVAEQITNQPWPGAHVVDTGRPVAESVTHAQSICSAAF